MTTLDLPTRSARESFVWFVRQSLAPVRRSFSQWIEEEIILPNGPYAGQRYRHSRHPASRLWCEAIDSGNWQRFAATGPTQNGKTLMCYVCLVLYHLFEIGETVGIGLPDMGMANDKWREDFMPVIMASKYRDLLPSRGEGSRGGDVKKSVTFTNGATLRFFTAGGSDKQVAGFTTRVVAITETDGMDEAGESSREADRISQIEARTMAYEASGKAVYLECTVSIERGRIWQEITKGTDSRIARPCPHCKDYVTPEREHLSGWQDAETEMDAMENAFFCCPACGQEWSEEDRRWGWEFAVLVHKGQEVTREGEVVGPLPRTQTLGFRWSAIDNPFTTPGLIAAKEWKALKVEDRENAEKELRQFIWAIPYEPPDMELTPLDPHEISQRLAINARGQLPSECLGIAVGIDTGKRALHWTAMAVQPEGRRLIIDYGEKPVRSDLYTVTKSLLDAFRELKTFISAAWGQPPLQVWIDSNWHEHKDAIYFLCEEANGRCVHDGAVYRPCMGYGEGQRNVGRFIAPTAKRKSADVPFVGLSYYVSRVASGKHYRPGIYLTHVNADHWKSALHQGLAIPPDKPGAVVLFNAQDKTEHSDFAQSITTETQIEKHIKGRGYVITWERPPNKRNNHYLDSSYLAMAASDFIESQKLVHGQRTRDRVSLGAMGK